MGAPGAAAFSGSWLSWRGSRCSSVGNRCPRGCRLPGGNIDYLFSYVRQYASYSVFILSVMTTYFVVVGEEGGKPL